MHKLKHGNGGSPWWETAFRETGLFTRAEELTQGDIPIITTVTISQTRGKKPASEGKAGTSALPTLVTEEK